MCPVYVPYVLLHRGQLSPDSGQVGDGICAAITIIPNSFPATIAQFHRHQARRELTTDEPFQTFCTPQASRVSVNGLESQGQNTTLYTS